MFLNLLSLFWITRSPVSASNDNRQPCDLLLELLAVVPLQSSLLGMHFLKRGAWTEAVELHLDGTALGLPCYFVTVENFTSRKDEL